MRSDYIFIPHLIRGSVALVLPGRKNPRALYTIADLRNYSVQPWPAGDRYFVRTGWGQDAGWTFTADDAEKFCRQMAESIRFKAVIVCESLVLEFGTECDILDVDRHWDSDMRLSYKGFQFWAGRGQWRLKVILTA